MKPTYLRRSIFSVLIGCLLALPSTAALAATTHVPAGQTLTLAQDLVLAGADELLIAGTKELPCAIEGNQHQIKADGTWTGQVKLTHTRIHNLGARGTKPQLHAFDLKAGGNAAIVIEHCIFDASAALRVDNTGQSMTAFRHNTILENSLVAQSKDIADSRPVFEAHGNSPAPKFFQGNRIFRGATEFNSKHWIIGGDSDAESNILIGIRVKISAARNANCIIRGNYLHLLMPINAEFPYYSQVSTVNPGNNLCEHNVIRDGEWIVRFVEGEFRYNVICDINDHNLVQNGSLGSIHHNVFFVGQPDHRPGSMFSCISIVYGTDKGGNGLEVYNNTFDGCGTFPCPGVDVCERGLVKSLRNNVFLNFAHNRKYGQAGRPVTMIHAGWNDAANAAGAARLGYADYNCFFSPNAKFKDNYSLTVAGKTERKDAGFARHDLRVGGAVDEQVDPQFTGPLVKVFPFHDEDITSGKVTVSQMLQSFRARYTPVAGSPVIDAGDPADGPGADIGAVGAGKDNAADRFGKWGTTPIAPAPR